MSACEERHLVVCWELPQPQMVGDGDVLSFLDLTAESSLRQLVRGRLFVARELAAEVKDKALATYRELIAAIAATPLQEAGGKTFRQLLSFADNGSYWWFHKVSEKDCETHSTFDDIIALLIIARVAEAEGYRRALFIGGGVEHASALRGVLEATVVDPQKRGNGLSLLLRGMASRAKFFLKNAVALSVVKRHYRHPDVDIDVALSGFWDWSVKDEKGVLQDRYFKSLPAKLQERGLKVGWFVWLDPFYEASGRNRPLRNVVELLTRHRELVLLQGFLCMWDLFEALFNFRPFRVYRACLRYSGFRELFRSGEFDLLPLLQPMLTLGFLNAVLPNCELVYLASRRAAANYRPSKTVSFLEFFLHSRAFYFGCRNGSPSVTNFAVQHASYCREKTFCVLDPHREYNGNPDSLSVPTPDYIFAMGEVGRVIFVESGVPTDRVLLTGSSRYEHVRAHPIRTTERTGTGGLHLLLATSLNVEAEMEMIVAVCLATAELTDISIRLRNHPFARVDLHPYYRRFRDRIKISVRSLDEDLADTDLVIFTSTTIAEESFIRGIPVWQWCSWRYNGSVFRDISLVPSFRSVSALTEALEALMCQRDMLQPSVAARGEVERYCFFKADGRSSERIACYIASLPPGPCGSGDGADPLLAGRCVKRCDVRD